MKIKILLFCVVVFFVTMTSQSQEVTGHIEGRILDQESNPVPDVNITITGPGLQGVRGAATGEDGRFRIPALPPGYYTIRITHIAHHGITYENVVISLGRTTTIGDITLTPENLEMPEVVIYYKKPLIDPVSTTIGGNLESNTFSVLPTERSYLSLITLLPHANTSYFGDGTNIAGSTGLENMYYIDGVNVTDGLGAVSATNLPYNFVKEIEVRVGGYEAEFGQAGGGIVNVITHSGGNEFHGQAFGFFTNNDFAGSPIRGVVEFDLQSYSSYDFGFSLGGPIMRDRLWFFTSYNPSFKQELINIPDLGDYTDSRTAHLFATKINWRVFENTDVSFSMFGDPSKRDRIENPLIGVFGAPSRLESIDPFSAFVEEGGTNFAFSIRHRISPSVLVESSLGRSEQREKIKGKTERGRAEPLIIDLRDASWSGGYITTDDHRNIRIGGKITGSLFLRHHIIKTGVEYQENRTKYTSFTTKPGLVFRISDSLYQALFFIYDFNIGNRVPSFFIQDSWNVNDILKLNAGLRWDGQYCIGSDGKVGQSINDQFQPRIGFVMLPGEKGTQKIFGSYGRFYQQIPTLVSAYYHSSMTEGFIMFDKDPRLEPAGGDTVLQRMSIKSDPIEGLRGQHYDEFILGYERMVTDILKVTLRGVYRSLGDVINTALNPRMEFLESEGVYFLGNPGRGRLSFLPNVQRDYHALELTLEKFHGQRFNFLVSYVISRNYGNFAGFFNPHTGFPAPTNNLELQHPEQVPNSRGLLPNDRTHSVKFNSSYRFDFGLIVGNTFTLQIGTPISELGYNSVNAMGRYIFIQPRGAIGRTPYIWDVNLRLNYVIPKAFAYGVQPGFILDIFHIGNPRRAVNYDMIHFLGVDEDGNQAFSNPNYMKATRYQFPMTIRLGMEVNF